MKRKMHFLAVMMAAGLFASCSKNDSITSVNPPDPVSGDTVDVRGTIQTSVTWDSSKVYRLRGYVYVDAPGVVRIQPGTQIISNKDSAGVLVVYKGAKLMAEGTAEHPIVFTSGEATPQPGDLGGVVLVGKATGNGNHATLEGGVDDAHKDFGGTDDQDNSGVLKFVRIEYGGKAVYPNDEINGLSLYAIGSGTTIQYVQVVRGLDDAFEFFGGAVNCKYLVAYNCADDDFDMDDGFHGKIQFAISVKDPKFTDAKSGGDLSNNFECDNTSGSSLPYTTTPITHPLLSNFTAIGPNGAAGTSADYGYGMRWRRGSQFEITNSIVIGGQKAGLDIDDDPTAQYYASGVSGFRNSFLEAVTNVCQTDKLTDPATLTSAALKGLVTGRDGSVIVQNAADVMLSDPFNDAHPNLMPQSGSPALTRGTKFEGSLDNPFFDKVSFVGAMGTEDWTSGWTVWNR
jgi:hypothetical protein